MHGYVDILLTSQYGRLLCLLVLLRGVSIKNPTLKAYSSVSARTKGKLLGQIIELNVRVHTDLHTAVLLCTITSLACHTPQSQGKRGLVTLYTALAPSCSRGMQKKTVMDNRRNCMADNKYAHRK